MNNRDPFRIRQNIPTPLAFLVRSGADFAAKTVNDIQDKVEEFSTRLFEDIGSVTPQHSSITSQHSFSTGMSNPVSRHHRAAVSSAEQASEDISWQQGQRNNSATAAVGEKIHDIFKSKDKDELPMYKDKPYNYTPSARKPVFWKGRRGILGILAGIALIVYWSGVFSGSVKTAARGITKSIAKDTSATWTERQERVREAFKLSWKTYEENAWGYDEYYPISKKGRQMVPDGMGWIIVDALDTMILMNLTAELTHAREWISTSLTYEKDHDVNTFETTIRMLGGLLSAHYLSTKFPDMAPIPKTGPSSDDLYLEKASDLADRLLGAYESHSGVPFASINLKTRHGIPSHADGGASSTAEAATLQLEMKYLSKLTGEVSYWEVAEKVIQVMDDQAPAAGLVPIFINADSGHFSGNNIRLGSRGDSYYEYLIKQYLQTSQQEPIYKTMWEESLAGVKKYLITYSEHEHLTILAERPSGLDRPLLAKMDHLVCFMPGTIALAATGGRPLAVAKRDSTWGKKQDDDMELAAQLMKTCWAMYEVTNTGLSPEISHFHTASPPHMMEDGILQSPDVLSASPDAEWRKDFDIHSNDFHNLQRPETVESLFYMWRITGDVKYREWGWKMFQAFMKHTYAGPDKGFSSVNNVNAAEPDFRDNMESFWLAESLKYFYLLFGPNDVLPTDQIVFNTEAHPFPRFELGTLFKTGWARKPRDEHGKVIQPEAHVEKVKVVETHPDAEKPKEKTA